MAPNKEILCIGTGALGTIYSYILERGGARVTAVARSNYDTLTKTGIHIASDKLGDHPAWKPHRVIRAPEEANDRFYDYILCTFKCTPDLKPTSEVIRPFLKKPASEEERKRLPTIVTVQNGVGIENEVRASLVDAETPLAQGIISAVAWIGANLKDNGTRVEMGDLEKLEMGAFASLSAPQTANGIRIPTEQETASLHDFYDIYKAGGGGGNLLDDIESVRWQKVLWNAAWGGLSTLARQPVNALLTESTLQYSIGSVRRIMLEILHVARACGFGEDRFPASSVDKAIDITLYSAPVESIQKQGKTGAALSRGFKPSILLDLENGRPMELFPIIGSIVERARKHSVETPRLDLILSALWPSQVQAINRAKGVDQESVVGDRFSDLIATSGAGLPAGAPVPSDGASLFYSAMKENDHSN